MNFNLPKRRAGVAAVRIVAPWLLTLIICSGQIFRGYDSLAGMAASCLVNAIALLLATWLWPPSRNGLAAMLSVLTVASAAIAWAAIATAITNDQWPEFATPRLLSLFSGLFALIVGALYARATGERGVIRLLDRMLWLTCLLTVAGVAILALGTSGLFEFWTVSADGRYVGMIGNANVTAAISGVFAVYAVGRTIRIAGRRLNRIGAKALLFMVAAIFMLIVLMITASRFPQALTAAALVTLIGSVLLRRRVARGRLVLLATALALVGGLIWLLNGDILAERLPQLSPDLAYRTEFWTNIANVVGPPHAFGFGLGSFPDVNAHFLTTPRMAEKYWMVNSAHDLVLQLLVVGGLPYLALLTLAAGLVCARVAGRFSRRWTVERAFLVILPLMVLACSTVDIALDLPVTTTLFLLLVGLLWGRALERNEAGIADA